MSASSPYTSASTGLLSWNFSGLQPFKSRTIRVILHTNTATSMPAVLLGDILNFSFTGNISQTDETPQNNQVNFSQVVNASYDPNNMVCLQGATEPEDRIGEYLNYTINFENIGTAAADLVVVATEIDTAKYDINSLQVLTASHPVIAKLEGNVLTFRFNNINLAPDGDGNAVFKIKSLATLNAGDVVMSKASIVFDSNPAIETNEAVTTFESAAEVKDFSGSEVKLYPNPTSSIIKVQSAYPIVSVSVYNVQGSLLETAIINDTNTTIDLSSRASGIYFVKVTTDKGVKVENVIRE